MGCGVVPCCAVLCCAAQQAGLRHSGSHFTLEMPFGPPFSSVWVEDLTVKVRDTEGDRGYSATCLSSEGGCCDPGSVVAGERAL